tara:strand:+ start:20143 stop:20787 length:645 start_codon:yes stop_codon:yes gene_type:complete
MKYNIKIFIILIIFIFGLYYYVFNNKDKFEQFENKNKCPNMLIEHNGKIYFYNSKIKNEKDKNPLIFNNLEEYIEFHKLQESTNKKCPLLFLQYTTDAQNEELLLVKPSIFENNGGLQFEYKDDKYYERHKMLDATKNSTPENKNNIKFNTNMYSGFDKENQDIGRDTPLDRQFTSNSKISANAYDNNWGGKKYTKNKINKGEYKDREVYKYVN